MLLLETRAKTVQHVECSPFAIGAILTSYGAEPIALYTPHRVGISVGIILRAVLIIRVVRRGKMGDKTGINILPCEPGLI